MLVMVALVRQTSSLARRFFDHAWGRSEEDASTLHSQAQVALLSK